MKGKSWLFRPRHPIHAASTGIFTPGIALHGEIGLRGKRFRAGWDDSVLDAIYAGFNKV
jgi:hypothetical protein